MNNSPLETSMRHRSLAPIVNCVFFGLLIFLICWPGGAKVAGLRGGIWGMLVYFVINQVSTELRFWMTRPSAREAVEDEEEAAPLPAPTVARPQVIERSIYIGGPAGINADPVENPALSKAEQVVLSGPSEYEGFLTVALLRGTAGMDAYFEPEYARSQRDEMIGHGLAKWKSAKGEAGRNYGWELTDKGKTVAGVAVKRVEAWAVSTGIAPKGWDNLADFGKSVKAQLKVTQKPKPAAEETSLEEQEQAQDRARSKQAEPSPVMAVGSETFDVNLKQYRHRGSTVGR